MQLVELMNFKNTHLLCESKNIKNLIGVNMLVLLDNNLECLFVLFNQEIVDLVDNITDLWEQLWDFFLPLHLSI